MLRQAKTCFRVFVISLCKRKTVGKKGTKNGKYSVEYKCEYLNVQILLNLNC